MQNGDMFRFILLMINMLNDQNKESIEKKVSGCLGEEGEHSDEG